LDIIINSLYTQKEVFIRELISNSADALDKIRFLSVQDSSVLGDLTDLSIKIELDPETKTISLTDSGIGMTKQDLINNLGTIAKSGTTQFIEALKGGNLNLIGQFGVGFYASFLAANKVTVTSKHNDDDQWVWESTAASSFTISKDPRGNTLKRGTKVTIHLKQDAYEYSETDRIRNLVKKYSEFINFPIYLWAKKDVTREVPDESAEEEEKKDEEGVEKKEEDELPKPPKTKRVTETVWDWELLNDNKAIWLRNREDIEEADYTKFYKSFSKDHEDPLAHTHFVAEGDVEFKSILFIPKHAPSDLFENYYGKSASLKLYVRRVLINEKFEELIPRYLNFIKGIVDSDDLPLNVSRESLQQLKMLKVMGRKLVRKALELITKLSELKSVDEDEEEDEDEEGDEDETTDQTKKTSDDETDEEKEKEKKKKQAAIEKYNTFWKEFGKNIKLGIIEDAANRNKLAKVARWRSSKNTSSWISLDDYVSRKKDNQDSIYYIGGEDREVLMKAPAIQGLLKKSYEVLLLDDPIDEYCMQHLTEYEKLKLVNVAKGDFKLHSDDDLEKKKLKKLRKMYEPLTRWWRTILKDSIEKVEISTRLVEDPALIVASEHGYSPNMERISRAQAYASAEKQNPFMSSKRILEINPSHPIIKELLERVKDNPDSPDQYTSDMATLLYDSALLNSGYALHDVAGFTKKFYKVFNGALGIPTDAQVEEIEVELDDEEEESKPSSSIPKDEEQVDLDADASKEEDEGTKKHDEEL
jgi:heat shock protein beta